VRAFAPSLLALAGATCLGCGCGEPALETRLRRYDDAVDRALRGAERPVAVTAPAALRLPARRHRLLAAPAHRIRVLDFLALQGCRLGVLAGERMSPLGRQLETSRRLVYELDVLASADACLTAGGERDRIDTLRTIVSRKRRALPIHVWNAVWAGPEMEDYLQGAPAPLGPAEHYGEAAGTLERLAALLDGRPLGPRDAERIEALLDRLRRTAPLGPVLRDLDTVTRHLSATNARLEGVPVGGVCDPPTARLVRAFEETWLHFVQAEVTRRHARARDELPLLSRIFEATGSELAGAGAELPRRMRTWHAAVLGDERAGLWARYRAALAAHVRVWRPILVACDALPADAREAPG